MYVVTCTATPAIRSLAHRHRRRLLEDQISPQRGAIVTRPADENHWTPVPSHNGKTEIRHRPPQTNICCFATGGQPSSASVVLLHFRAPKEGQVKSVVLGRMADPQMCPIRVLTMFLEPTAELRATLPSDHTLFLL